mmetsp:Transcript_5977/g.16993  ORF Transcript_5977/g.16993 Transcript_5977/m.16993 type:complete len:229 (-) Transcript_5977:20-706(-)
MKASDPVIVTCIGSRGIPKIVWVVAPLPPSSIPFCSSPLKSLLLIRFDNSDNRSFKKLKKWVSGRSLVVGTHTRLVDGPAGFAAATCCCFILASTKPGRASAPKPEVADVVAGAEPHRFRFRSERSAPLVVEAAVGAGTDATELSVATGAETDAFERAPTPPVPAAPPYPTAPVKRAAISFAFSRASSAVTSDILFPTRLVYVERIRNLEFLREKVDSSRWSCQNQVL